MAIIKYPILKTHVQQSVGKNVNFEMHLRVDGAEELITDKVNAMIRGTMLKIIITN
jgi:hypothetical protein